MIFLDWGSRTVRAWPHTTLVLFVWMLLFWCLLWSLLRSSTPPSASITGGTMWSACPLPAPAWTSSSFRSSATSSWWGASCSTPSSRPRASSSAERPNKGAGERTTQKHLDADAGDLTGTRSFYFNPEQGWVKAAPEEVTVPLETPSFKAPPILTCHPKLTKDFCSVISVALVLEERWDLTRLTRC